MASFQAWSWHLRRPQCPPISRCLARSRSLAPSQRPRLLRWLQHCLSRHYYCSPPSWRQRHLRRPRLPAAFALSGAVALLVGAPASAAKASVGSMTSAIVPKSLAFIAFLRVFCCVPHAIRGCATNVRPERRFL